MNRSARRAAAANWKGPRRQLLEAGRKYKLRNTYLSKAERAALNKLRKEFPEAWRELMEKKRRP